MWLKFVPISFSLTEKVINYVNSLHLQLHLQLNMFKKEGKCFDVFWVLLSIS